MNNKYISTKYNILTKNIKYYRLLNNLTQEQLAERSDLSVSYIKQIELGHIYKNISFGSIAKIASALNVEMENLFKDKQTTK